jgi:hypothetical protein
MIWLARRGLGLLVVTGATAIALSACAKSNATTPVSPTPNPTPTLTTEAFSGILAPTEAGVFPFTVSATGTVRVTLTEVGPANPVALGLSVGLWNSTTLTCDDIVKNEAAETGTALVGKAEPGSFCARVYDVGNVVDTMPYKLEVIHP